MTCVATLFEKFATAFADDPSSLGLDAEGGDPIAFAMLP
jgi:hypothetical protein